MIGRIHLKRTIKQAAGCLSVATRPLVRHHGEVRACIFVYHRVAEIDFIDPHRDDWNVPPQTLDRQIRALSEFGQIIPLADLPHKLDHQADPSRPWICLTFDDGYANFYHRVVPVLQRYQVPATLFVPTSVVGSELPMLFDGWARENHGRVSEDAWRAISWEQLERCIDSGFVSIGSHSHQHLNGCRCRAEQFEDEANASRRILLSRLGPEHAAAYAYPYGSTRLGHVPPGYVQAVRDAGYELAVTTDLGLADGCCDRFQLPRIEAHPLDGPSVIRAKASGSLKPYFFTDRLRKSDRS